MRKLFKWLWGILWKSESWPDELPEKDDFELDTDEDVY